MSAVPSPPLDPKPGKTGYNDKRALAHLLFNIIKVSTFEAQTGSSEIISALDAAGITTLYKDLAILNITDLMNLEVLHFPSWKDPANPIPERDAHKIPLLAGR